MKTNVDFVIASSEHYVGFLSTNITHPVHGYAPNVTVKDVVEFLDENWPGCTKTSDNLFDDIPDKRGYTERDKIFTNKIETRLKELEAARLKKKIMSMNKKDLDR